MHPTYAELVGGRARVSPEEPYSSSHSQDSPQQQMNPLPDMAHLSLDAPPPHDDSRPRNLYNHHHSRRRPWNHHPRGNNSRGGYRGRGAPNNRYSNSSRYPSYSTRHLVPPPPPYPPQALPPYSYDLQHLYYAPSYPVPYPYFSSPPASAAASAPSTRSPDPAVVYPRVWDPQYTLHSAQPIPQDPHLDSLRFFTLAQVEYYMSSDNLPKDSFLRQHMDSLGFVDLALLATFNRIRNLLSPVFFPQQQPQVQQPTPPASTSTNTPSQTSNSTSPAQPSSPSNESGSLAQHAAPPPSVPKITPDQIPPQAIAFLLETLQYSVYLEVDLFTRSVRRRSDWHKWILPDAKPHPGPIAAAATSATATTLTSPHYAPPDLSYVSPPPGPPPDTIYPATDPYLAQHMYYTTYPASVPSISSLASSVDDSHHHHHHHQQHHQHNQHNHQQQQQHQLPPPQQHYHHPPPPPMAPPPHQVGNGYHPSPPQNHQQPANQPQNQPQNSSAAEENVESDPSTSPTKKETLST